DSVGCFEPESGPIGPTPGDHRTAKRITATRSGIRSQALSSPAGRPWGEPAVRHGAARERRRSAYEAPHGSVAPGPVSSGAESKRRRCPRSRARTSRVTLLVSRRRRQPEGGEDGPHATWF